MNRWLMAVAVGLFAVGCAESVEDPQPGEEPGRQRKDPPAQTFSGELDEPAPIDANSQGSLDAPALPMDLAPPQQPNW